LLLGSPIVGTRAWIDKRRGVRRGLARIQPLDEAEPQAFTPVRNEADVDR
jgi:hypothetical protein